MQKYQVFINQHCIFFSTKDVTNEKDAFDFHLESPLKEEVISMVDCLLDQKVGKQKVLFSYSSEKKFRKEFESFFKLIEAAGGLVRNSLGEYLFIYRFGYWDLPKGKLEKGESKEEGAIREVQEECGISDLNIQKDMGSTYHIYKQKGEKILKRTNWFLMDYSGDEKLLPQKEEAIEKAEWVKEKDMEIYISNTYESIKCLLRFYL